MANREYRVARVDEIEDGQMKEVEVDGRPVLLIREEGRFRAFAGECSHFGAPLAEGTLCDHRIRCPWHQSVFDSRDGSLVEPPALDMIRHYQVRLKGEEVYLSLPDVPEAKHSPPPAIERDESNEETVAIIGAGAAGSIAAETLRRDGFTGRIVMLTKELAIPYDRTELSKRYLRTPDAEAPSLRSEGFYDRGGVEVLQGYEVERLEPQFNKIICEAGTQIRYDRLLLATGGAPKYLDVPGAELDGVTTLRTLVDSTDLRDRAGRVKTAAVIGASFIAMEVAASLTARGVAVRVIAPESVPFAAVLGQRVGRWIRSVHEEKGTQFHLGAQVQAFEGDNGAVRRVVLAGGETLEAELVVMGIGVRPVTNYVEGLTLEFCDDESLPVDEHMKVRCDQDNVYAAGDIATFPDWRTGEPMRIEHWRLAQQLGMVAGHSLAGKPSAYHSVPFFWSGQHGIKLRYVGHAKDWDEVMIDGDPDAGEFCACYLEDGRVRAAAGVGRDRQMAQIGETIGRHGLVHVDRVCSLRGRGG